MFGVYCNGERKGSRIIPHDVNGPSHEILPWDDSVKVDQRLPHFHGTPKAKVVRVSWIGSTIPVVKEIVALETVVIGRLSAGYPRSRRYR
jgi:hypothetical protein